MRQFILLLLCLGSLTLTAQDKQSTAPDEFSIALKEYLDLSGARNQFDIVIDQMIDLQRNSFPGVANEFWDEFSTEIHDRGFEEIVRLMEPIYREHFLQEELDALVAFYGSEIGQSIASKTSIVTQESMQIGAEWGATLAADIMQRLQEAENSGRIQRH